MGETGVRHVMKALLADFDILMNVGGFQNVEQMMDRSVLGEFPTPLTPQGSRDVRATALTLAIESYPKSYGMMAEKSKL